MFEFVIRYLSFLKRIPLLPHIFEAMLKLDLFLRNRKLLNDIDALEQEILTWEGITPALHHYGGIQFNLYDKEIGHLHGNGMLDILFSRKIKAELLHSMNVSEHHTFKNSGWISFAITQVVENASRLGHLHHKR